MDEHLSVSKILKMIICILLILLPVFFLPFTQNFFDTNKWALLVITAVIVLILWTIRTLVRRTAQFYWTWPTIAFGVLLLSSLITFVIVSVNKTDALTNPYGLGTLISCFTILVLGYPLFGKKEKIMLRMGSVLVSFGIALFVIYQQTGVGKFLFPTVLYLQNPLFSPLGTPTALITYLLLMIPWSVETLFTSRQKKNETLMIIMVFGLILIAIALSLTVWRYIPTMNATRLPVFTGAEILIKSWQQLQSLLVGTGAEGFLWTFTKYRPVTLNTTPLWLTGFTANASMLLHIGTIYGFMGFSAFLFFIVSLFRTSTNKIEFSQILLATIISIIFPPAFIFFPILILFMLSRDHDPIVQFDVPLVVSIPTLCIVFGITVLVLRGVTTVYHGEVIFAQALAAKERGNGTRAYTLLRTAIEKHPTSAILRHHLAQTNLAITRSLISAAPVDSTGKPELTADDKTTIQQLVTAGIKESKLAVTLAPDDTIMWTGMATLYQQLVGIAGDADIWSIAAYKKAMTLDPTNPVLHVDLGGLYVTLKKYDDAYQEFLTAVTLKPNYANAYYNMANLFREQQQWEKARKALTDTKQFLDPASSEYAKVTKELEELP